MAVCRASGVFTSVALVAVLLFGADAFTTPLRSIKSRSSSQHLCGSARTVPVGRGQRRIALQAVASEAAAKIAPPESTTQDPLLLRTARGEEVERVPVWMMRQAGRHMQVYRDLVGKGMGIDFTIEEKAGPKIPPMRTWEAAKTMHPIEPEKACPFVGETLRELRRTVGNEATVLGFVGLPYTLATYLVEGQTSKEYLEIKKMMFLEPELLHTMLKSLADSIGEYANYQIESGAQVIQIFDSWAGHLSPRDYDTFAAPYQSMVVAKIKEVHPEVPIIIYINKSGALLERMATSGVDIVSLDWTVTVPEARKRIGDELGIQGNLDPAILFGDHATIKERTEEILCAGGGRNHVMNLGHGIEAKTSEENAEFFINTVKNFRF